MTNIPEWKGVSKQDIALLLSKMVDLFADRDKWIFYPRAEDAVGKEVAPSSETAAKWCLMGAGEKFAAELFPSPKCNYVECALREFLDDAADGKHNREYEDEYALICLAYEFLTQEQ